eukprot:RCo007742
MKLHSVDGYLDLVKASEPIPPLVKKKVIRLISEEDQARELQAAVRKQKEQEFSRTMELARKDRQRRIEEQNERKEKDFEDRYQTLMRDHKGFVAEMGRTVQEIDQRAYRKKEALHHEWLRTVHAPLQHQIIASVESQDPAEALARRREAMDAFLTASRKKGGQLFRDIILEAEYDPLMFRDTNHLRVKAPLAFDPCKPKSLYTEAQLQSTHRSAAAGVGEGSLSLSLAGSLAGSLLQPGSPSAGGAGVPPLLPKARSREILPVPMWNKVESTPYGRYAADASPCGRKDPRDFSPSATGGSRSGLRAMCDDYNLPTADVAKALVKGEQESAGKKIVGPMRRCESVTLRGKKPVSAIVSPSARASSPRSPSRQGKRNSRGPSASQEATWKGKRVLRLPPAVDGGAKALLENAPAPPAPASPVLGSPLRPRGKRVFPSASVGAAEQKGVRSPTKPPIG